MSVPTTPWHHSNGTGLCRDEGDSTSRKLSSFASSRISCSRILDPSNTGIYEAYSVIGSVNFFLGNKLFTRCRTCGRQPLIILSVTGALVLTSLPSSK